MNNGQCILAVEDTYKRITMTPVKRKEALYTEHIIVALQNIEDKEKTQNNARNMLFIKEK